MKKINNTPLALAIGTAVVSTFTVTNVNAEANPFAVSELSDGYMQVAQSDASYTVKTWGGKKAKKEASCGEGKCGGMMDGDKMKKGMETSCGAMMKGKEGSCGVMDEAPKETKKVTEAKCGEGKCGDMMKGDKMKKGMEHSCGEMMKGKEGMCGEMMKKMKKMKEGMKGGMDMKGDMDMKGGEMACGSNMKM